MSHEHRNRHRPTAEVFGLDKNERLWYVVKEKRFQELINDESVTIHDVGVSSNFYGEYLFVTLGKTEEGQQALLTFYGLGFNIHREQWITDHWHWYTANPISRVIQTQIPRKQAIQMINERRLEVEDERTETHASKRAMLFRFLADLTDEDGALSEIEDLESRGIDPDDFDIP